MSKLRNVTPPWMSKTGRGKENVSVSYTHEESPDPGRPAVKQGHLMRSKSHPKISGRIPVIRRNSFDVCKPRPRITAHVPAKKRVLVSPLSPVKASPPVTPTTAVSKENSIPFQAVKRNIVPNEWSSSPGILDDLTPPVSTIKSTATVVKDKDKSRKWALMDLTGLSRNFENLGKKDIVKGSDLVKERVRDWERERGRLREIAALEEMEQDRDEEAATQKQGAKWSAPYDKENDRGTENGGLHVAVAQLAPRGSDRSRPRSALGKFFLLSSQ